MQGHGGSDLAAALEAAGEGVLKVDAEGILRFFNRPAAILLDRDLEGSLGLSIEAVLPAVDEEARPVANPIREVLTRPEKGVTRGEVLLRSHTGEEVRLEGSITPLRMADGRPDGAFYLFRREERRHEIRTLLHEINNSLGAVRGYCEIASLKGESGEALDRRLAAAVRTIEKITHLLRKIRHLS